MRLLFPLIACGGGSTSVSGTYRGRGLDVSSSAAMIASANDGSHWLVAVLSSGDQICTSMQAREPFNGTTSVAVQIGNLVGGKVSAALEPGTYPIGAGNGKIAVLSFGQFGDCGAGALGNAKSGSVEVSAVSISGTDVQQLSGTFTAIFDTGDTLTGKFSLGGCSGVPALYFYRC